MRTDKDNPDEVTLRKAKGNIYSKVRTLTKKITFLKRIQDCNILRSITETKPHSAY